MVLRYTNIGAFLAHTGLLGVIFYKYQELQNNCSDEDKIREADICTNGYFYDKKEGKNACADAGFTKQLFCADGTPVTSADECKNSVLKKVCLNGYLADDKEECPCERSTSVRLQRDFYINDYRRDSCAREKYEEKCEFWPYSGYKDTNDRIDLFWMLVAFTIITIVAHGAYVLGTFKRFGKFYNRTIKKGKNPFRWVEYALSAPIMLVILALLASIRNENQLILIWITTAVQMFQGWIIEDSIAKRKISVVRTFVPLFTGWLLLAGAWYGVFDSWYRGITASFETFDDCAANDKASEAIKQMAMPPDAIKHALIATLLLFSSFGIINVANVAHAKWWPDNYYDNKQKKFRLYETAYIIMSFASKATLIFFCMFSIFDGELSWLQVPATFDLRTKMRKILIDPPEQDMQEATS